MTGRGINLDPLNPQGAPVPAILKAHGFDTVRLVARHDAANTVEKYAAACRAVGLGVLQIITSESQGQPIANATFAQFGNEPDGQPPSSWVMPAGQYVEQFNLYAGTYPQFKWIAAGLAAGDYTAAFWRSVAPRLEHCAGFSLHPYGKGIADAKALILAHQRVTPSLPAYVTEWNRPAVEIPGFAWMLRNYTAGDWWFAWSDGMVAPFGLVDASGNPKPELAVLSQVPATRFYKPPGPPTPTPRPITWVSSPNYWNGRPHGSPVAIVLHTMAGSLSATDGWFGNTASQVSAHYGVGLDGSLHQYVKLGDRAWANGVLEPGNDWPGPPLNPNEVTVSIETEDRGDPTQVVTDQEYAAALYAGWQAKQVYPGIQWLLRHTDISPHTRPNCPGNRWINSGRFAALATALGLKTLI
jgi:hypothetical protein